MIKYLMTSENDLYEKLSVLVYKRNVLGQNVRRQIDEIEDELLQRGVKHTRV